MRPPTRTRNPVSRTETSATRQAPRSARSKARATGCIEAMNGQCLFGVGALSALVVAAVRVGRRRGGSRRPTAARSTRRSVGGFVRIALSASSTTDDDVDAAAYRDGAGAQAMMRRPLSSRRAGPPFSGAPACRGGRSRQASDRPAKRSRDRPSWLKSATAPPSRSPSVRSSRPRDRGARRDRGESLVGTSSSRHRRGAAISSTRPHDEQVTVDDRAPVGRGRGRVSGPPIASERPRSVRSGEVARSRLAQEIRPHAGAASPEHDAAPSRLAVTRALTG